MIQDACKHGVLLEVKHAGPCQGNLVFSLLIVKDNGTQLGVRESPSFLSEIVAENNLQGKDWTSTFPNFAFSHKFLTNDTNRFSFPNLYFFNEV